MGQGAEGTSSARESGGDQCPFCAHVTSGEQIIAENEYAAALPDGYPISVGHTLIIPKRHAESFFSLEAEEQGSILELVRWMYERVQRDYQPDGVNLGLNDGRAAGQTVAHAHVHLIPRYSGDCEDPRGGVRWILPEKAEYW